MPLNLGYQYMAKQAMEDPEAAQKRKLAAMQALQQTQQGEQTARMREAQRAGYRPSVGAISGAVGGSAVPQQRELAREQELAARETAEQRAAALGQLSLGARGVALEEQAKRGEIGLAERAAGFQEQIMGRKERTSQENIGLMQDEVGRIEEALNEQGRTLDRQYKIQIATLNSAADQFNQQIADAEYQYEQGRISKEQLVQIQMNSKARLAELERQYQSTINNIQRATAIEVAAIEGKGRTEAQLAAAKAAKAGEKTGGILGGITGTLGGIAGFMK